MVDRITVSDIEVLLQRDQEYCKTQFLEEVKRLTSEIDNLKIKGEISLKADRVYRYIQDASRTRDRDCFYKKFELRFS